MRIIRNLNDMPEKTSYGCVTIGNFDGVHLGHQQLLAKVVDLAESHHGTSVVITFDPHPLEVLRPGTMKRISSVEQRTALIEAAGTDLLLLLPFTAELAATDAEDFITSVLVDRVGVRALVVGYDYLFGRGRTGDIDLLKRAGRRCGFSVNVVAPYLLYGEPVSSSRIRRLVAEGNVERAGELLGRPWQLSGEVVHGQKRGGAELGFPTANLLFSADQLVPMHGVYVSRVLLRGQTYGAVTSIGHNPTFAEKTLTAETFILDFDDAIYGEEIVVFLLTCLRKEKRFHSADELRRQISADVDAAVRLLAREG